jgi:hypothetical protein
MPGQPAVLQLLHAYCDRREAVSFHHRKVQERLVALDVSEPRVAHTARRRDSAALRVKTAFGHVEYSTAPLN